MSLTAGTKLGPYEILASIGAGGMGEVYRAKDPRLGREVAIKVLPAAFSQDADRLAKFAPVMRSPEPTSGRFRLGFSAGAAASSVGGEASVEAMGEFC